MAEAPGRTEIRGGEPFSGVSGTLLDKVLDHHGLKRSDILVTHTVLCRPKGNPNNVPAAAIRACKPRLDDDLSEVETVVTLGATAADVVAERKDKITSRRVGPAKLLPTGQRHIPTIHPAAALRVPDHFPHIVQDLGKINSPVVQVTWEPPEVHTFDDADDAVAVLDELSNSRFRTVALDIEVGVDKDQSFTHPKELLCVGLAYKSGSAVVIGEKALHSRTTLRSLSNLLDRRDILCHNGKFDLQVLHNLGIRHMPRLRFDSMLGSYALDERPGTNGLKYLAQEFLGAPDWSAELDRYLGKGDSYAVIPRPVLYKYNGLDAALTLDLWETIIRPELEQQNLAGVHDMLVHFSEPLMAVEAAGLGLDVAYMDEITETFLETLDEIEKEITDVTHPTFNPRSPKQVSEQLAEWGFRVTSTDVDTLTALKLKTDSSQSRLRQNHFLRKMLEYRKQHKLYSTYVKGARKREIDGRVYPTILLHGTTTGRTACRNPNLQNVPRDSLIRRLYVPAPGNVFIQTDYKSAELRVMGTEAHDEWLRKLFADGRDIHSEIARARFGDNFTKDQRVRAKAVVYGVGYGREAFSLAEEYGISESEAQSMIDTLFSQMKDVKVWRDEIQQRVLEQGYLETSFGRRRRQWLITRDNKKDVLKESLAFIPQSTSSDITLHSLRALYDAGYEVRIPVHDSNMVEVPQDHAEEAARDVKRIMEKTAAEVYDDYIPFEADVAIGDSWGTLEELNV